MCYCCCCCCCCCCCRCYSKMMIMIIIIILIIIPFFVLFSYPNSWSSRYGAFLTRIFIHSCDCWLVSGMSQRDTHEKNEGRSSSSSDCAAG
ncbi:hypothetical protein BDQ94DRAFT_136235 [Aspergillus welwitschiae]|uniref:Uncharacterized protein n=1 Tax=Aspergillus welwitschiae TaxID=1341132 RepID=A0A3F3QFB1_9EURO|nr:hypothetical protein BDQ94DRAFT_136235 [Aspergillus welwitschiae]RDH37346.1 hypothetical protein BDQ94DRAFT_136235 [Aspergillus welwitschiae]